MVCRIASVGHKKDRFCATKADGRSAGDEGEADDERAFAGDAAFDIPNGIGGAGFWIVAQEEIDRLTGMDLAVIADLDVGQQMR